MDWSELSGLWWDAGGPASCSGAVSKSGSFERLYLSGDGGSSLGDGGPDRQPLGWKALVDAGENYGPGGRLASPDSGGFYPCAEP